MANVADDLRFIEYARRGNLQEVIRSLENGCDPGFLSAKSLRHAAENGFVEIVKLCVMKVPFEDLEMPLIEAAVKGQIECGAIIAEWLPDKAKERIRNEFNENIPTRDVIDAIFLRAKNKLQTRSPTKRPSL